MIDGQPSRTALMVAAMRAHHNSVADEPKILRDNLALVLGGFGAKDALMAHINGIIAGFTALSDADTAKRFIRNIEHSVCMRSRLVEERITAGLENGLQQLVIMGAGLDSTAYRLSESLSDIDVFEVDHPATQAWKRARLKDTGITIPGNLTYVAFDFENQTLAEALSAGGVKSDAMSLFPWLGVQPYLTPEAVKATVSVMGSFPKGSELVMDYVAPSYELDDDETDQGLKRLGETVSKMGEPFLSLYTPQDLEALLRDVGFGHVSFPTAKELRDDYLDAVAEAYAVPDDVSTVLLARV